MSPKLLELETSNLVHGFVWRMTSRRTKISPKTGRGLGHVTHTIFGSTSAILVTAWLLVFYSDLDLWPLDHRITPPFISVRVTSKKNKNNFLLRYNIEWTKGMWQTDRQTNNITKLSIFVGDMLYSTIFVQNGPLIILVLVWRKSIHFWQR